MTSQQLTSTSAEETQRLAGEFARRVQPGDWVGLTGPLGAGKSVWVRGMARGLGITEPVVSPSFTLVNVYRSRLCVCHVDLYRIRSADELMDFGLDTLDDHDTIVAVEWADRLPEMEFDFHWLIDIQRTGEHGRMITLRELKRAAAGEGRQ
jgi:tRNA threonylcarbamoyladenosine biosynthesis protein TsaE